MLLFNGCSVSFNGVSIDANAKTVSVAYFQNVAPIISPRLSQTFTEKFRNKFVVETKLQVVPSKGDLQFSGKITGFTNTPVSIGSNQTTSQNRLTITATVKFVNLLDEKKNFESTFTNFEDYSSTKNFSSIENDLIDAVTTKMIQDIFNKAVINW
jgi:hypothetical protein